MNAQNAQSIGYEDGNRYFRLAPGVPTRSREELLQAARNRAFYTYRVSALKTTDLYVAGWQDAIDKYEREQAREAQAAAERAAIPHNPNTRFCMCVACSQQGE